ncbi:MAG: hypothetical protein K0S35_825 [Geminicoccaceae bacterium]|jgi:hypothetical protein|nr:hypothetical protein [Geminicoccaceae bacterium]
MSEEVAVPARRVRLDFRGHGELGHADQAVRSDLSTVTAQGRCLWVANDELATVEQLTRQDDGSYAGHEVLHLAEVFDLPEAARGEMDIEGLDIEGGYLWVVGSHSLTREKPKPGEHDPAEALARLTEVKHHPNRHFLGRVPLVESGPGMFEPRPRADDGARGATRRSACLKMKRGGDALDKALRDDVHIARFMGVPAKENGFDIEGIAARGDRVFLGLRGPVLRGWALLLELRVEEQKRGRLKLRKLGPDGARYAKHFLDLAGLGIRDLAFAGDALLILAGPTMDLDGPVVLYRWPGALAEGERTVVPADQLESVLRLPYGRGEDHAEGICWLPGEDHGSELLVVYDSPADGRLHADTAIDADVFRLEAPGRGRVAGRAPAPRRVT